MKEIGYLFDKGSSDPEFDKIVEKQEKEAEKRTNPKLGKANTYRDRAMLTELVPDSNTPTD